MTSNNKKRHVTGMNGEDHINQWIESKTMEIGDRRSMADVRLNNVKATHALANEMETLTGNKLRQMLNGLRDTGFKHFNTGETVSPQSISAGAEPEISRS